MLSTLAANALTILSYDYSSSSASDGVSAVAVLFYLVVAVAILVGMFKLFAMAGEPGWTCIIPFVSNYKMFKIAYGNGWKFLLVLVPILGEIISIMVLFRFAKAFGRSTGFAVASIFFSPICLLIMAFDGKSIYQGPDTSVFI